MTAIATKSRVYESLADILANTYALALKTQNYHWNVTSPHFKEYHALFEEQYDELNEAIDMIAERIRAVGFEAPGTLKEFSNRSSIADAGNNLTAEQMITSLVDGHRGVIKILYKSLEAARDENDPGTEDMIIERLRAHEKTAWMLESSNSK